MSPIVSKNKTEDAFDYRQPPTKARGGVRHPFPTRLYSLLEKSRTDDEIAKMISWHPSGQSFKVHNAKTFSSTVQKTYFKHTVYSSFRRQLNLWGFKRISEYPRTANSQHAYYANPMFARGQYSLCCQMRRAKVTEISNVNDVCRSPSVETIKSREQEDERPTTAISTTEPIGPICIDQLSKNTTVLSGNVSSSVVSVSTHCTSSSDCSSVTSDSSSETIDEIFQMKQVSHQESIDFFKQALAFLDGQ